MLRIVNPGVFVPVSYPVDPNASFLPGMIAQLKVVGNDVVAGISDGLAPFGIIDDIKESTIYKPSIDEVVIIDATGRVQTDGYNYYTTTEVSAFLNEPSVVERTFVSDVGGLTLVAKNGALIAPAGTPLNYRYNGSATPNAIRAVVSYSYVVPGFIGDDSVSGSGRVTIWVFRGIFQTDQYDTTVPYALNATLFVNSEGKLTTEASLPNMPAVAMCTAPPTAHHEFLEFLWFA